MNVPTGVKENIQLMRGLHMVADIQCLDCREALVWKCKRDYEESQKYKEWKFMFEKANIAHENW